jgi:PhnB protein
MELFPDFVPSGYKTVTVSLVVKNAERALRWYNSVFSAQTTMCLKSPDGRVVHGEFRIFDTTLMISEEAPERNALSPESLGGTGAVVHLYTDDAEGIFAAAVDAGAEVVFPLTRQFYGDKSGRIRDPFGHEWIIARHEEDLTASELQRRFNELYF